MVDLSHCSKDVHHMHVHNTRVGIGICVIIGLLCIQRACREAMMCSTDVEHMHTMVGFDSELPTSDVGVHISRLIVGPEGSSGANSTVAQTPDIVCEHVGKKSGILSIILPFGTSRGAFASITWRIPLIVYCMAALLQGIFHGCMVVRHIA